MRIIHCEDIFKLPQGYEDAVCITTNGVVKNNGHAVMGAGIAFEANQRFKLSKDLGALILENGNQVYDLGVRRDKRTGMLMRIFSFPTKHDWAERSDINLIKISAVQLMKHCDSKKVRHCYLPCPGCSNGQLDWETQVRPVLEPILNDKFIIADKNVQTMRTLEEDIAMLIESYTQVIEYLQRKAQNATDINTQVLSECSAQSLQDVVQNLIRILAKHKKEVV